MTDTAATEPDWEALGRQAFHNGEHAAPALNATVMAHLAGRPVGDPHTMVIMRGFTRGWDAANMAAPVPGIDDTPDADSTDDARREENT